MSLDPVELLAQLVAIPSVSPMGREVSGPEYLETRLTEFLVRHFQRLDVPFEVHEVMPGRANVIVHAAGRLALAINGGVGIGYCAVSANSG